MNKLDVLEDLLPGFQQFLSDLTTCRLTSALEAQVIEYNQNIEDYISQNYSIPTARPPSPPPAVNGVGSDNTDAFIAEQRELSRLAQMKKLSKDDSYYNVEVGSSSQATDVSAGFDNVYENPTKVPPVPTTSRPPNRGTAYIDDMEAYEDPDSMPVKIQTKSATMPVSSKPMGIEPEGSDSGGTFMSFHSTSSSQPYEDGETYEDVPDFENSDFDDDGSTELESYDEEEIEKHAKKAHVDSNANKTKRKSDEKTDVDKLALFQKRHGGESSVDQLGLLYTSKKGMTISKRSFGQWGKRYCLAKDMRLLGYKKCDSKEPAMDLLLFGYTVTYIGQEGRQSNVFSVSHPNRGTEMFSAESKEAAEKWIEVLRGYATMDNELVPSTGYVAGDSQGTMANTGDEITKKLIKFFSRDKKKKEMPPQLTIDESGVLSGLLNIMGAKYGEPKWRKKFVMIKKGRISVHAEDGNFQFDFPLNGTDMIPADPKITRRKVSMQISLDNEALIYVEMLNHLDMGPFLKKFAEEMVADQKKDLASPKQRGMVSSILRAFEKQDNEASDQEQGDNAEVFIYDDVDIDPIAKDRPASDEEPKTPTKKITASSVYTNFKIYINVARDIGDEDLYLELLDDRERAPIKSPKAGKQKKKQQAVVMQHANRRKSATPSSPKLTKKFEEETTPDSGKKDKKKKEKEKKDKKDKKDKKGKGKEETAVAKEEEVVAKEPAVAKEPVKRTVSVRQNKFLESNKSHLLDVDRLQIERKEVETRKRAVTKRKADLSAQKRETTDPKQKEGLEVELAKAQQEWSECSNRLAFIDSEIQRFTKGGDNVQKVEQRQQMRMSMVRELSYKDPLMVRKARDRLSLCSMRSWSLDSASAELVRNGISDARRKEQSGETSPGRQVAEGSVGNVQGKLKVFQNMGNK